VEGIRNKVLNSVQVALQLAGGYAGWCAEEIYVYGVGLERQICELSA